jgi:chaperonin GroES
MFYPLSIISNLHCMKLRPVNNYVTIEVKLSEEKTQSGIILANGKKPTSVGTVVAIPSSLEDLEVKVGDTIMFSVYQPLELSTGDYKVSVIEYSDIYGVLE